MLLYCGFKLCRFSSGLRSASILRQQNYPYCLLNGACRTLYSVTRDETIQTDHAEKNKQSQTLVNPLADNDYFKLRDLVTVEDLFKARVHYGHKIGCRHVTMQPYIFGCRNNVDVIDLNQTHEHLLKAMNFLAHMVYAGGLVLFIMKSHIHGHLVEKTARECGEFAHTRYWVRTSFTASRNNLGKASLPNICVFLSLMDSSSDHHIGVVDCTKVNIPTIGIADTNSNPSLVTYPVPGNDDSQPSLELYCKLFKTCVMRAKERRKADGLENKAPTAY